MITANNSTVTNVTASGIAVTTVVFFRDAIIHMIPWLAASIPLIILDLDFGIKAATYRGERIRFSKAFRRTFGKMVEYFAWVCFAATASLAFNIDWVEWVVLGAVYINELASIAGNYFETKGIELSLVSLWKFIFKKGAGHYGVDVTDDELGEIIKPKPNRDEKGRFTKN